MEDAIIKFESGCGLFIKGFPDGFTETDIYLYFDSETESSGWEGCVLEVKPPTDVGNTRYAVAMLKDVEGRRIVNISRYGVDRGPKNVYAIYHTL